MSLKAKRILTIYAAAAIIVLGLYAWVSTSYLGKLRLMSGNGYGAGFESSIYAVDNLSQALRKSEYAADSSMCGKVCAEIYANSLAAEATLANLPFATQELENLQAFLNTTGDYAYSVCGDDGFTDENVETFLKMSEAAKDYEAALIKMRGDLSSGAVTMDSRETRLRNFPEEDETKYLSAAVMEYERGFEGIGEVNYDGLYAASETAAKTDVPESEMKAAAAEYLDDPQLAFEYRNGERCYTDGKKYAAVGENGVYVMWSSRLVPENGISEETALEAAENFLKKHGFTGFEEESRSESGNVMTFVFASGADDAARLDAEIKVSVALDDGSVYAFSAQSYEDEEANLIWTLSEDEAKKALPAGKTAENVRKTVIKSPGGKTVPCYELTTDGAKIYVNAETGKQQSIVLTETAGAA